MPFVHDIFKGKMSFFTKAELYNFLQAVGHKNVEGYTYIYFCSYCNFCTDIKSMLVQHCLLHHLVSNTNIIKCFYCMSECSTEEQLTVHLKEKHKLFAHGHLVRCYFCTNMCSAVNLNDHLFKHFPEFRSLIYVNEEQCIDKISSKYHDALTIRIALRSLVQNLVHTKSASSQSNIFVNNCPFCSYSTTIASSIIRHITNVHLACDRGPDEYIMCPHCDSKFFSEANYRQHVRTKKYYHYCPFCKYLHVCRSKLECHITIFHKITLLPEIHIEKYFHQMVKNNFGTKLMLNIIKSYPDQNELQKNYKSSLTFQPHEQAVIKNSKNHTTIPGTLISRKNIVASRKSIINNEKMNISPCILSSISTTKENYALTPPLESMNKQNKLNDLKSSNGMSNNEYFKSIYKCTEFKEYISQAIAKKNTKVNPCQSIYTNYHSIKYKNSNKKPSFNKINFETKQSKLIKSCEVRVQCLERADSSNQILHSSSMNSVIKIKQDVKKRNLRNCKASKICQKFKSPIVMKMVSSIDNQSTSTLSWKSKFLNCNSANIKPTIELYASQKQFSTRKNTRTSTHTSNVMNKPDTAELENCKIINKESTTQNTKILDSVMDKTRFNESNNAAPNISTSNNFSAEAHQLSLQNDNFIENQEYQSIEKNTLNDNFYKKTKQFVDSQTIKSALNKFTKLQQLKSIKGQTINLNCPYCSYFIVCYNIHYKINSLKNHCILHHLGSTRNNRDKIKCYHCSTYFTMEINYREHLVSKHCTNTLSACPHCDLKCVGDRRLNSHIVRAHFHFKSKPIKKISSKKVHRSVNVPPQKSVSSSNSEFQSSHNSNLKIILPSKIKQEPIDLVVGKLNVLYNSHHFADQDNFLKPLLSDKENRPHHNDGKNISYFDSFPDAGKSNSVSNNVVAVPNLSCPRCDFLTGSRALYTDHLFLTHGLNV